MGHMNEAGQRNVLAKIDKAHRELCALNDFDDAVAIPSEHATPAAIQALTQSVGRPLPGSYLQNYRVPPVGSDLLKGGVS